MYGIKACCKTTVCTSLFFSLYAINYFKYCLVLMVNTAVAINKWMCSFCFEINKENGHCVFTCSFHLQNCFNLICIHIFHIKS